MTTNTPKPITPTWKDLAECSRLGLLNRLIDLSAVSQWVDGIIESENAPPAWAIELALHGTDWYRSIAILESVPGKTSGLLPRQILVALVRRKWLANQLTAREVTRVVFALLPDGWESTDHMSGIFQFDHIYFECLDTGHSLVTEEQADQMLNEFLSYYNVFDCLIPACVL